LRKRAPTKKPHNWGTTTEPGKTTKPRKTFGGVSPPKKKGYPPKKKKKKKPPWEKKAPLIKNLKHPPEGRAPLENCPHTHI